jgi:hypothetical protein
MNVLLRATVTAVLLAALAATAAAFEKVRNGGTIGNSYASNVARVDDATMRITTRKKMEGDLEEVNKPGTTMYNSLQAVQNAAAVRAAVEAKALGYKVLEVQDSRDLTSRKVVRVSGGSETSAGSRAFAPAYRSEVELKIELVVKAIPGEMPTEAPGKYLDVDKILKAFNIDQ